MACHFGAMDLHHQRHGTRRRSRHQPGIVAQPDAVYFDRLHRNFAYVRQLAEGDAVFVAIDTADTLKHTGTIDALVNAYRLDASANGVGRLANRQRFVRMGESR